MKFSLKNQVAIVTGAGSGIGKAIAKTFAERGARVCVLETNTAQGKATCEEINQLDQKAFFYQCDVSDTEQVQHVFEKINTEQSGLDILINNAGIAHVGNIEHTSPQDLDRLYQVNVKGIYNCMRSAVAIFKATSGGVILNMASIASSVGLSDRFAYSMTKGAVLTMTYSVAKDYIADNIRCNCISPGRVHTPFVDGFITKNYPGKEAEMFEKLSKTQPIGRMGKPQEIADLALFLCSKEAGFITGANYAIDGGFVTLQG